MNADQPNRIDRQVDCKATFALWMMAIGTGLFPVNMAAADEISSYERALADKQITDLNGVKQYLRDLHPSHQQRQEAVRLIEQLSSDIYSEREAATVRLLIIAALPVDELTEASESGDPETRWRAKSILTMSRSEGAATLHAVFRTIKEKKMVGVAEELLSAIPLCEERHLRVAAREALEAIVGEVDADLLRSKMKSQHAEVRAIALSALAKTLGNNAAADFGSVLDNSEEVDSVKIVAARAIADHGDRRSLRELIGLLASDDVYVRVSSSLALNQLTRQRFGFAAYDKPEQRAESIQKWQAWAESDGQTAKLTYPLKPYNSDAGYLNGNTLLAFGYQNKVVEYDPAGKEVWSYVAKGAWSAEKLPNGNVLIAAYNQNQVIEVDSKGTVVWSHTVNTPLNARPLHNGNILISAYSPSSVQEVNREKKVVWEAKTSGTCCDAHRLENGNTMYCAGTSIFEVTPDGKTVWEYSGGRPFGIQPLKNGNLLICDQTGSVKEITRDKKVVWEVAETRPCDAFRLPNGNTLVTGGTRFVEYTPDKKIVWQKDGCKYGTARR